MHKNDNLTLSFLDVEMHVYHGGQKLRREQVDLDRNPAAILNGSSDYFVFISAHTDWTPRSVSGMEHITPSVTVVLVSD